MFINHSRMVVAVVRGVCCWNGANRTGTKVYDVICRMIYRLTVALSCCTTFYTLHPAKHKIIKIIMYHGCASWTVAYLEAEPKQPAYRNNNNQPVPQ